MNEVEAVLKLFGIPRNDDYMSCAHVLKDGLQCNGDSSWDVGDMVTDEKKDVTLLFCEDCGQLTYYITDHDENLDGERLDLGRFGGVFSVGVEIPWEESLVIDYCYKYQNKFFFGGLPISIPREGADTPSCHCDSEDILLYDYYFLDDNDVDRHFVFTQKVNKTSE